MNNKHQALCLAAGAALSLLTTTGCVASSHTETEADGELKTDQVTATVRPALVDRLLLDSRLASWLFVEHADGGSSGAVDSGSGTTEAADAGASGSADTGSTTATAEDSGAPSTTPPPAVDSGSSSMSTSGSSQIGASFLSSLGKSHILVGASMEDAVATQASFDARYMYLAGGLFDSAQVCSSCTSNCTSWGSSCSSGACGWWGCWQDTAQAPGQFAKGFFGSAQTDKEIPVISYYELLQASGSSEGSGEVGAANDLAFMTRYLNDWRFLNQQIGSSVVIMHIEPDFWGYAEQVNSNPHAIPAAVATANPTDCGSEENSIAGMGRCMIAMTRKYAPNAKVGLHASSWGVGTAALLNSSATYSVTGAAQQLGQFLIAAGAQDGDFIAADATDRDAGYYTSTGQNTWWDTTNTTLPNFHQAFAWSKALAETLNLGVLWWQLPVGNMALANQTNAWTDNRVDYFFAHTDEVAAAHGVGMLFGAGATGMTTPSTDNGNLVSKTQSYAASGGQAL